MIQEIIPEIDESPLSYAHRLSRAAAVAKTPAEKQNYGQYFTSLNTAKFMASFSEFVFSGSIIRILDPGCGTAVLSCALIENLLTKFTNLSIELVCCEADPFVIPFAKQALEYLKLHVQKNGSTLDYKLFPEDFLSSRKNLFYSENANEPKYDIIISNPPFFKLPPGDDRKEIAQKVFGGQANIYSLFVYASVSLLKTGGELIFLIPRSFCSGSFFADFRKRIYDKLMFKNIHLYTSQEAVFEESGTLEDSIILKGILLHSIPENYEISISRNNTKNNYFNFNFSKTKNIIPLPASKDDEILFNEYAKCTTCLKTLGYKIAGGKALKTDIIKYSAGSLVDECNKALIIKKDGENKTEYIEVRCETAHLLIQNGNYIFLRRYNKTERERKISAFAYINKSPEIKYLCIDKQQLYISPASGLFSAEAILQITKALNCERLNRYLYIVYGNINLSPSEMENIPIPDLMQ